MAKIVIPRLNVTSHYILSELEEKEREEVFRLKRVKQKKDFEKKKDEIQRRNAIEDRKLEENLAQSASKPNRPNRNDGNALQVIKKEDE